MSDLDHILKTRGKTAHFEAPITGIAFSGETCAFALGDGTLRMASDWRQIDVHKGAILSLCAHPGGGFLTGGDDGALAATSLAGAVTPLATYGRKWVEHVAAHPGKNPLIAAGIGKELYLLTPEGKQLHKLTHASTVTGIDFDAKGKRVATSHYNGATIWFTAAGTAAKKLEWKGSHTGVTLHPDFEAIVTSMQENALHGWRLPDEHHMRMSGYPAKTESMQFTRSGRWLATAGADAIVLWPFFGGGPMGKAPKELAASEGIVKRVATHPAQEVVAAGFDTGLTLMADLTTDRILPLAAPGRGPLTALAWSPTGTHLALGTDTGFAALIDLTER
jgi:WD40 repeat protein